MVARAPSEIKNKKKREAVYNRQKAEKKAERRKAKDARNEERERLGEELVPKLIPRTLENTRVFDADTQLVAPDDREILAKEEHDEFSAFYGAGIPPKVLLTTCRKPSGVLIKFCKDLLQVFPTSVFYERGNYDLQEIIGYCNNRDFTDVVVVNENRKKIDGMIVSHLPNGPTADFKMSSVVLHKEVRGHGKMTKARPEVILNRFGTRLGRRVGRMLGSLFCVDPNFRGRRAITFHNQRDFIFFRHHRYVFEEKEERMKKKDPNEPVRARLQEIGPRFTLKLKSLQVGTFDPAATEFEWKQTKEKNKQRRLFEL